jgi:uncharacterized protein YdgA (DUF945 family)
MKKRYLVLAVLIAAIVIVPKFVSTKVTGVVNDFTAEISKINGYDANVVEFNEGWFSSNGKIIFTIDLATVAPDNEYEADQQTVEIDLDFTSTHGPVFFGPAMGVGLANWTLVYSGDNLRNTLSFDQEANFYQLTSTYGLFGHGTVHDSFVAFTAEMDDDESTLNFSGYQGEGTYSSDSLSYKGLNESFTATGETGEMSIDKTSLKMEVSGSFIGAMAGAINDSKVSIKIGSITFFEPEVTDAIFLMQDMSFVIDSDVNDDKTLLALTQNFSVSKMTAMDYEMNDLTFNYQVNNVSVPFFVEYQKFAQTLSAVSEDDMEMQSVAFFQQNAPLILQADPQLKITNFSGSLPEGEFSLIGDVQLSGIEALPEEMEDPQFWITHLTANAEVLADKGVALLLATNYMNSQLAQNPQTAGMTPEELQEIAEQQSPMMVDALVEQGLLVDKDEKLTLIFTLKDSQAILNGNPIPLPF